MDFVVSARKYRPNTFDTVVGQNSITSTLRNAIKNEHLAQAFLFCGSRGVGKTSTARILAKTINCSNKSEKIEACEKCDSCLSFNSGSSLNVYELDAASNNGVDEIRNLIDQVRIAPQLGEYKVYIIDEVHMLSQSAFNAFLKTLEEPPKHAIFILATTEKHKIIPTILSRCQIFDFARIKVKDIADHLALIADREKISAEPEALHIIAQKADGALRDALSIFDQIVTYSEDNITYENVISNLNILDYDYYFSIVESTLKEDIPSGLIILNEIIEKGFDPHNFIVGLANHYRNLLVCKDQRTAELLEVSESIKKKYIAQSQELNPNNLVRALGVLSKTDVEYKISKNQRLLVEMAIMQLCSIKQELEKKKSLTDIVEIIPFENEEIKDFITKENTTNNTPEKEHQNISRKKDNIPTDKKEDKNSKVKILSIKEMLQKNEEVNEEKKLLEENIPKNEYTLEELKIAWEKFAFKMKKQRKETIYNALIKRAPKKKSENEYILEVDNQIQIDYINPLFEELTSFIRSELNNYLITFKMEISQNQKIDIQFQTGKEKFMSLAKKNPNLHKLKERLNLEIEY
ncbi:MAG: DNA polymerase III subunit gamma/tau [Crocinitomicaceae bacterium]|nr:DNA polymerase III subunit gamma/tau [Crocinitomicaceae bacterium]|tara:strand:- start:10565 stop:12295 length:1731 start_codon:yes stop_codon:yes gene_type:complete